MKILITGISGFVGPHLKQELELHTHSVFGIDRSSNDASIFSCDLTKEDDVRGVIERTQPDWIVHLAALTSVVDSWKNPEMYTTINSLMTKNIYEAVQKKSANSKILLTSSSDVYGPRPRYPITEDATPHPQNPYAQSKLAQEKVAHDYSSTATIISRAFNHTGPGTSESLVVGSFAKQIALCEQNKQKFISVGNLEASRDFLDVRDVIRAYRFLIEKGSPGEIYNICSGTPRKIQWILDTLLSLSNKQIEVKEDPEKMRPSDVPEFYGSSEKIKNITGWSPTIPFEQTLEDTLNYWRRKV